jgi:hypothetical protein
VTLKERAPDFWSENAAPLAERALPLRSAKAVTA